MYHSAIASTAQLQRFVKILVSTNFGGEYVSPTTGVTAPLLLLSALSSGQFWELPNVRSESSK
jgi:hypothetical protein